MRRACRTQRATRTATATTAPAAALIIGPVWGTARYAPVPSATPTAAVRTTACFMRQAANDIRTRPPAHRPARRTLSVTTVRVCRTTAAMAARVRRKRALTRSQAEADGGDGGRGTFGWAPA